MDIWEDREEFGLYHTITHPSGKVRRRRRCRNSMLLEEAEKCKCLPNFMCKWKLPPRNFGLLNCSFILAFPNFTVTAQ
jgi:hypothetical protein